VANVAESQGDAPDAGEEVEAPQTGTTHLITSLQEEKQVCALQNTNARGEEPVRKWKIHADYKKFVNGAMNILRCAVGERIVAKDRFQQFAKDREVDICHAKRCQGSDAKALGHVSA
jgi:hypothetical protein